MMTAFLSVPLAGAVGESPVTAPTAHQNKLSALHDTVKEKLSKPGMTNKQKKAALEAHKAEVQKVNKQHPDGKQAGHASTQKAMTAAHAEAGTHEVHLLNAARKDEQKSTKISSHKVNSNTAVKAAGKK